MSCAFRPLLEGKELDVLARFKEAFFTSFMVRIFSPESSSRDLALS
ncbi:MAG: hypothetical protein ACI9W2_002748 [Gammaproteobacteria bacterium]|jgi:hypothetical protein